MSYYSRFASVPASEAPKQPSCAHCGQKFTADDPVWVWHLAGVNIPMAFHATCAGDLAMYVRLELARGIDGEAPPGHTGYRDSQTLEVIRATSGAHKTGPVFTRSAIVSSALSMMNYRLKSALPQK